MPIEITRLVSNARDLKAAKANGFRDQILKGRENSFTSGRART
jgi:hypothetical protein